MKTANLQKKKCGELKIPKLPLLQSLSKNGRKKRDNKLSEKLKEAKGKKGNKTPIEDRRRRSKSMRKRKMPKREERKKEDKVGG